MSPVETLIHPSIDSKTPWPDPNQLPPLIDDQSKKPLVLTVNMATREVDNGTQTTVLKSTRLWNLLKELVDHLDQGLPQKELKWIAKADGLVDPVSYRPAHLIADLKKTLQLDDSLEVFTQPGTKERWVRLAAQVSVINEPPIKEGSKTQPTTTTFIAEQTHPQDQETEQDRASLSRIQSGDKEAFGEEVYQRYEPQIYRHLYYRLGQNQQQAEDATSQVFLKAYQAIGRYQFRGYSLKGWLYQIAHNWVIDQYKIEKDVTPIDEKMEIPANCDSDPLLAAEQSETRTELQQAILKLKEDQQEVVRSRYLDGLEYAEIARNMHKSEGAVRVLLHRSLLALRALLQGDLNFSYTPGV